MLQSLERPSDKAALKDQLTARNIIAQNQFSELAAAFNEDSIPFMPLKGIVLLDFVYEDISRRYLSDIDVLVRPVDLGRIERAMIKLGYSPVIGESLSWSGMGMPVDLHTGIWYMSKSELCEIWLAAREAPVSGVNCKVLPNEEMIIYAVAHSVVHHGLNDASLEEDIVSMFKAYQYELDVYSLIHKLVTYNLIQPFALAFESIKFRIDEYLSSNIETLLGCHRNNITLGLLKKFLKTNHPLKGHILMFIFQRNIFRRIVYLFYSLFPSPYIMKRRYGVEGFIQLTAFYALRPFIYTLNTLKVIKKFIASLVVR